MLHFFDFDVLCRKEIWICYVHLCISYSIIGPRLVDIDDLQISIFNIIVKINSL